MKNTIKTLEKILESHALWAQSHGYSGKRANFSKFDFGGITLKEYNLSYADFSESNLKNVTFKNCRFTKCRFDGSNFENTQFLDCVVTDSSFEETDDVSSCCFTGTNIACSDRLLDSIMKKGVYPSLQIGKLYRLSGFMQNEIKRKFRSSNAGAELPEQDVYYAVVLKDNEEGVDILVENMIVRNLGKWTKMCGFQEP